MKSVPITMTHWKRWWPGRNVVGCLRSAGSVPNALALPGGMVTSSKLWLK